MLGFKDGKEKYAIFKDSKMILHPAIYDSGGMAAAEGMAWGLPGISFDLEALKTYYPKGMVKTKCFDKKAFADNILKLLSDTSFYEHVSKEARELIFEVWDWDKRADKIYTQLFGEN
jgi:glycosyltransferase involved in cell wall biosynthesis